MFRVRFLPVVAGLVLSKTSANRLRGKTRLRDDLPRITRFNGLLVLTGTCRLRRSLSAVVRIQQRPICARFQDMDRHLSESDLAQATRDEEDPALIETQFRGFNPPPSPISPSS